VEPGTNPAFLYQQNTMRDAMIAGLSMNIFNNRCDRVRMANLAQTVNVLQAPVLTRAEGMILTPTYHVLEMYTVHHDAVMLPVEVNSNQYVAGKDTLKAISVSASRDRHGVTHMSLVNIDPGREQAVSITIRGSTFTGVSGRILVGNTIQDHNTFDAPSRVAPKEWQGARLEGATLRVPLPPCSVVVLTLK
jgi:alpha-N-arabinofuranosidase